MRLSLALLETARVFTLEEAETVARTGFDQCVVQSFVSPTGACIARSLTT